MELKTLVQLEKKQWKERLIKETSGLYVLNYIGVIFSIIFSALYGFSIDEKSHQVVLMLAVLQFTIYEVCIMYLAKVTENGKTKNIYKKYVYCPISLCQIKRAKVMVVCKIIAVPTILSQGVSLAIRILDPDRDGGHITDWNVWMPLFVSIVVVLFEWLRHTRLCYEAMKEKF